ncbi:MAG: redox-sensing transcriptional repressor Rex [Candidatus Eisenbacteria bacterium]
MSHISEPTVRRLSNYYRVLEEVAAEGKRMISSHLLAEREGITSAQVRKDLSSFGSFGRRGLGYHVEHLRDEIRALLGLDRRWKACLVGAGHIGSALVGYRGFSEQGFDITAVFDADAARVGRTLEGLVVRHVSQLGAKDGFEIGVIATPVRAAQEVADVLVAAGVQGILNFAPRKLRVPAHVTLRTVDMTMEFESLSYALTHRKPAAPRRKRTAPGDRE